MAKKATSKASGGTSDKGKSGGVKRKAAGTKKPASARKAAKPKPETKKTAPPKPKAQKAKTKEQPPHGAADVVIKLLESPLVVDLIAVGATAALAAIAEQRFGRRDEDERASSSAAKAAGKAAAAAMGRRIATEVEEILKASKEAKGGAKA